MAISTVVLLGSAAGLCVTVHSIGEPPNAKELTIDVIGQEWWWGVGIAPTTRA